MADPALLESELPMRIMTTCLLFWFCASTAISQGTTDARWQVTLRGTSTQCSFNVPYGYLKDTNSTWSVDGIGDLQVADAVDGHSNYHLDSASGIVIGSYFWSFSLAMADWNIDRTMVIAGGPASSVNVDVALWGVRHLYSSTEGYWEVTSYNVPEPSSAALVMLGVVAWCLRRKLGGSAANRASVVER